MNNPTVTVLMTVYNGEDYLSEAIKSILNQSFTDFEFLIIDDASTDNSQSIIQSFNDERIRYVKNESNIGQTASLNYGLELSKGEYIARMDQDDLSKPDRFSLQLKFMEKNYDTVVVGSWAKSIDADGKYIYTIVHPTEFENIREAIACGCPISHSSAFFRRDEVVKSGGYPEGLRFAMDWGLWIECIKNDYQIANLPYTLVSIRTHKNSVTSSKELNIKRMTEIYHLLDLVSSMDIKKSTMNYSNGLKLILCLKICFFLLKEKKMIDFHQVFKNILKENPIYLFLAIMIKVILRFNKHSQTIHNIEPIQYKSFYKTDIYKS